MKTILTDSLAVTRWVARMLGDGMSPEDFGAHVSFGVLIDGEPAAGVIYSDFRQMTHGNDIRVTIAASSPRWIGRDTLRSLFLYPFETAGCGRVTAVIKEGNRRSEKLCRGLGFRKEGVVARGYDGKSNAIIYGLLRDQCKWIKEF